MDISALSTLDLYPAAVNAAGQVTGTAMARKSSAAQAFTWSAADGFRKLGRLPGSDESGYTLSSNIGYDGTVIGLGAVSAQATTLIANGASATRWAVAEPVTTICCAFVVPPRFGPDRAALTIDKPSPGLAAAGMQSSRPNCARVP